MICPEGAIRNAMSDGEFWEHVFQQEGLPDCDVDEPTPEPYELSASSACPICKSPGACGYDESGLPMIHALPVGDD